MLEVDKKRSTIFCDIDGTILRYRKFGTYAEEAPIALPDACEKLTAWNEAGHVIILTTARPEELRQLTINELASCNIPWSQLVMGIGRGSRYVINDESSSRPGLRAFAHTVKRDEGLGDIDLPL